MEIPEIFSQNSKQLMGEALYRILSEGLQQEAPTSIRLNPFKCNQCHSHILNQDSVVAWCPEGIYLKSRPNFTFDPLFHAGLYYVQEASSMFLNEVLRQLIQDPVNMLDLCAAPGGKSTVARTALPEGSLLIANEPDRTRANILAENIQKFGHSDVIVTNNYARDFQKLKSQFDVILTDVPCSGEGMFRKDSGAISEWSEQNVEKCWRLQRDIVSDIWPCLKPGGLLIYSTCTFNDKEDEQNANWIASELGAKFIEIKTKPEWMITGSLIDNNPMYRFIPGKVRGEGLFMAVLQKDGNSANIKTHLKKSMQQSPTAIGLPEWIQSPELFDFVEEQDELFAIPKQWKERYGNVQKALRVIHAGIKIGTRKGHNWTPNQSLALSHHLKKDSFPTLEISYSQAIAYLRKEAIILPQGLPLGFTLLTFKDIPIGFVKNIGNRANNLFPQEWRIRSTHLPDTYEQVIEL